ncbi:MAG: hypothetical protein HYS55_05090, partial [Candidatus Omnitrophica bacterium]|nr:hypothetical protein [Candidatus Omnitrophota bacterium]
EYPQVDYIYDDELWRITAQLSDVHFIRLNISLKDDAQAKVVEWSLSKGFQSTDFKWEGNPILAVKVKSNGSFEFIVARNFIVNLDTYFAHKYSNGEASEILNILVGDSKVPKKITRSHNRAEVRNIENSPKEVSIEAPLSPRSEAKRAEVRLRAEMRLPGEGEQHRIQILARERARSLFLGEGFTVFDRPVEVHSDDRSVAIDALAEPSEDSSRFLVKVFVRFKNPELIHFFKQQRAFYYVSKRKNIASFLYRNEIAVGLVRIIPSMIKGISESFPAKIPEQVTPKAQEESSREPLATTITELVMSSQEKKRVYGLLSKIQQEHPGVSLVKLVPPIELTGDASLMRYLLWRIDKQFVKGIKSLPSLDESERIETFRQKVQSLVGSNQLHRAEVRSIPVESSTLAPRAAESPRAEVREVEWRKLSDRGRAKLSDYAFSADQPSKGSQLRQESQKRQSEGNQAFFVPSIRGGLLGDRTTPKANRTTIIIPETTRTATGKRANPPVINAVPNRISDSLNNELDNLSRRYDSSIGDTIAPEVRGVNKNYNEYDKKLIPPRRAEVRGHVERPAIIPPLLKKYKSKLKGLNTSQAARVMGVSEPGLSLHFHAHPEYFGRYGIVRGKAGRIPTITDKDQQLINHYIRLVQQKKGVLPTVQVLADQFRVSHQAISDRIRALKGKGVVLKTKYARRAEVRHIENSPKEVSIEAPLSPRSEAKRAEAKKRLIIPLAKLSDAAFQEKFLEVLKQRGKDSNLEFAILATGFELQAEREVLALFRERNIFVEYNVQLFGSERFGQDVKSEAALMNRVIELMRKEVGLRGREFSTRVITVGDTRLLERIGRRDTPKLLARPEAIDAALLLFELDGEIDWFKIAPNGYIDPTRGFIASLEHLRLTSLSFNRAA